MQWQEEAARRHLAFTVELPRKGMFFIAADWQKLSGALGNIIENAILYTPEGSVAVTLSVEHDCCVIEIQDTGIGIAPADLPSIFNRLFRAQNAMLYKTYGNGLGLYVTKEIIEEHEGSIQVQSELGKGTRVTVRLPLES